ncbi:MAG: hypothetical protein EOP84_34495 [Verrucomicrobiaceae bacterium]|nr:MAG: hypothetical protein EOP84_34495 [Verrucomicrobiaceae bacterium]
MIAWHVWKTKTWNFSNFEKIRDNSTCEEYAARGPAERAQEVEQERNAMNQQISNFLAEDQQRLDEAARALDTRFGAKGQASEKTNPTTGEAEAVPQEPSTADSEVPEKSEN